MTTLGSSNVLAQYAKNKTTFSGEDGVLEEVFNVLGVRQGWCVEFGAWDGKLNSNTYSLIVDNSWSSIQIEGDPAKFNDLAETYIDRHNIHCLNRYVSFEGEDTLDRILAPHPIPTDFDLLCIDIDGNDYHVWESFKNYHPKVVMIEFNASMPNSMEFIQPRDLAIHQGTSLRSIVKLAKSKGYELIATTIINAIFVKKEYFSLFGIENNAIDLMRDPTRWTTTLCTLYDGTLMLAGNTKFLYDRADIVVEGNTARLKYRPAPGEEVEPVKERHTGLFKKLWHRLRG